MLDLRHLLQRSRSIAKYTVKNVIILCADLLFHGTKIKNNKVLFLNFRGRGYGGNPGCVCEYLRQNAPELDLVWLTNEDPSGFPAGVRTVRYSSLAALYEQATAHVWVINVRMFLRLHKRKGQYYIQVWHGFGYKNVEAQLAATTPPEYLRDAKYDGKVTDLMVADSPAQVTDFLENFWYSGEIMEAGMPRKDVLFNAKDDLEYQRRIRDKLGVSAQEKIVLFAPTFRDAPMKSVFPDFERLRQAAQSYFHAPCKVFIRLHPNMNFQSYGIRCDENILNATYYPDVQELLLAADFLVTDYSSVIDDFSIMQRPIVRYCYDLEECKTMRGLGQRFFDLPYPLAATEDELEAAIKEYDTRLDPAVFAEYERQYRSFGHGDASKQVGKRIRAVVAGTQPHDMV